MFFIRLSKDLEERLSLLSSKTNRAKSYYVTKALTKFLAEEEEIEWAAQAYKEYLESGKKEIPFQQVMWEVGLVDENR